MIAVLRLRAEPTYRSDAFAQGLKRAGYTLQSGEPRPQSRNDLLVIWNRQAPHEREADAWEDRGGTVLVCENGYAGKDAEGRQFYAIAVHGHNGSGWFPVGDEKRFPALGIELAPWRNDGVRHLICGQRGIGTALMASPPAWEFKTSRTLKGMGLPHHVRRHPGRHAPATTLDQDLVGVKTCVIWSSSAGVKALAMGIPVVYCAPHWICGAGAGHGLSFLETAPRDDAARERAMEFMAWGQRSIAEIESGEPFVRIRENLEDATWSRHTR
jgi:hypothetical protein